MVNIRVRNRTLGGIMGSFKKEQIEAINQQIKELVGIYRDAVADLGMSENEFWIWYSLIIMRGEYTQQDICESWSLSKQTVNTIINRMVRDELVELEVIPGTRNKKVIRLTEKGKIVGESLVMPIFEAEKKAIDRMPKKDISVCLDTLSEYIKIFREEMSKNQ